MTILCKSVDVSGTNVQHGNISYCEEPRPLQSRISVGSVNTGNVDNPLKGTDKIFSGWGGIETG